MPRKDAKVTMEDLKIFLAFTTIADITVSPIYLDAIRKMGKWAEGELARRKVSGQAGGRPRGKGAETKEPERAVEVMDDWGA